MGFDASEVVVGTKEEGRVVCGGSSCRCFVGDTCPPGRVEKVASDRLGGNARATAAAKDLEGAGSRHTTQDNDTRTPAAPQGAFAVTEDQFWAGIHRRCGGWTPCLDVQHLARDARCYAERNCVDVGREMREMFGADYLVSSGGGQAVQVSFSLTPDRRLVGKVTAGASAEDVQLGSAMMARIASALVPEWSALPLWAGASFSDLAKLGGNFGEWSRSHPTTPSVEAAFQRVKAAVAAGLRADQRDLGLVGPYAAEYFEHFNPYIKACGGDGGTQPAECVRSASIRGFTATMRRSEMGIMMMTITADE